MPNYDVILKFILDQAEKQKTTAGVDQLTGDLTDVDKIVRAANKDFEILSKQIAKATSPAEFDSLQRKLKDVNAEVKHITDEYQEQARLMRAQAAAAVDNAEKVRQAQLKIANSRLAGASRSGLLASGALIGGVFAEANRFAKEAEDTGRATRATREWTAATQELAAARAKVDNVLLKEALPLLQQATKVAAQVANFVEDNPAVVHAALETGKVVAGLSLLGSLATKGITLYTDSKAILLAAQDLTAAKIRDGAADKNLMAERIRAGAVAGDGKQAAGGLGLVNTIGLITAGIVASGAVITIVDQLLEKYGVNELQRKGADAARDRGGRLYPGALPPNQRNLQAQLNRAQDAGNTQEIERLRNELDKLGEQSKSTADDLRLAVTGLAGSTHEAEIVAAFEKWKEEDTRIVQEAAEQRVKIVRDAEDRIVQATAQYANRVRDINAAAENRATALAANFLKDQAQTEAQYQEQRAEILRNGGQEIREIEEAHQERLRKLTKEHGERVEDLTASRDALGLAKEQRRFNQEQAEENRSTRMEIAKRRADLAERLADLDRQNQAERAQRLAQFQEALAENEAQRKDQLKQAAAAHAEEMKQIRTQRAQQLRELQEGLNAERIRRREFFVAQVRDLDAALLGERDLRNRHYAQMIADAERFLAEYRSKLPTATAGAGVGTSAVATFPDHDFTGYAMPGIYRMAADGQKEYVLSGKATRAAEQIIGRGLTQDAMLSTLARGSSRGGGQTININDHSRFDGRISAAQVREIKQQAIEALVNELTGD